MKLFFVLGVFFVAMATVSSAAVEANEPSHVIQRRETIQGPTFPNACVFYECIASCRQRGHKSGGYCTINGCQCLR